MHPLLSLIAGAAVTGVMYATDRVPSQRLANKWSTASTDFFCKPGTGPEEQTFRLAAENFFPTVFTSLLVAFLVYKYARFTIVKVLTCTAVIYSLTFAIIGFMRYTHVPAFKAICEQLTARTQASLLTEPKDLITPFLSPLSFLPPKLFTDNIHVTHTYAIIYPHLGEYFVTIEPYLLSFFVVMGVFLEIKPLRNFFWTYLPVIGAMVSFCVMGLSDTSDFVNAEPYDLLLNTILQYVVYYAATFVLLCVWATLFRLGMRRISVVGLMFIISRLHILGLPKMEFHLEMLFVVFLISILVTTLDFSPGTFILFSILSFYNNITSSEWSLVALFADNVFSKVLEYGLKSRRKSEKVKRE